MCGDELVMVLVNMWKQKKSVLQESRIYELLRTFFVFYERQTKYLTGNVIGEIIKKVN